MNHFNSRTLSEKEKLERSNENYIKQLELSHRETVEELQHRLQKQVSEQQEKEKYWEREKADLQTQVEKLRSNDYLKLESK